ncbi:uncharacterized protein LOC109420215 [Aedes albopictus]|uniref:Uncharacterized protein n=1 Tax=Aedes albopictus TaxID=7160 RepID=A0ABM1Z282_AEDAL
MAAYHTSSSRQQQISSAFRPWTQRAQMYAAQHQLLMQQVAMVGFNVGANGMINGGGNGVIGGGGSPGGILALSQEPPELQNPESVVRLSESDKFDRSLQPNVALAPRKTILCKERERERERERDREKERSVIKCDVQIKQESPPTPPADVIPRSVIKIKQERPSTPPTEMSPGLRVPSSPRSPPLPLVGTPLIGSGPIKSVPLPYSPGADMHHSGSNEITSSTSPVPPAVNMTIMNGCISEKPKLLVKEQIRPPSPRRTPTLSEDMLHHHRSHPPPAVILKNGGGISVGGPPGAPIVGNPEFELSTDTDDDSLAGEPDSSNISMAPLEIIADVMKDIAPETREQLMSIFKLLIQETAQIRNRLLQDNKQKDDLIARLHGEKESLQHQVHHLQQQLNRSLIKIATSESLQIQHQQDLASVNAVPSGSAPSSTPPSPLSLASNGSSSQIVIEKIERRNSFPQKSDVIMKPLKKCLRRSPDDDSVLQMLQSPPPPPPPPPSTAIPGAASLSISANPSLKRDPSLPEDEEDDDVDDKSPEDSPSLVNGGAGSCGVIASPSPPRPPSRPASAASTASNGSSTSSPPPPPVSLVPVLENGSTRPASGASQEIIKSANN